MASSLVVVDQGQTISYSIDDLMRYHGPGFPGGVAPAFKVMELGFSVLSPDEPIARREVVIRTPFAGPGARDAFEMVTRSVTEGRYFVVPEMRQVDRGILAPYFFEFTYGGNVLRLRIKPGHVREEFISLGANKNRTTSEDDRLTYLKQEMASRLLSMPAADVYEAV